MKRLLMLLTVLALLLAAALPILAQSGGPYDLSWSTIDGGGYTFSTDDTYSLGGTAGQPDAGALSGGSYTLGGGFWGGGAQASAEAGGVYLPIILRNSP